MKEIMKTIDKIAILCILALAASCGQKNDEPTPVNPEVQPETRTLTFVLPEIMDASVLKSTWEPGDQIVVHGEYAKNQVVVTLAASDISADGLTATKTVEGLYPYKREDCTSTLYAAYPASAVDNLKHCFFYSKFSTTNADLMAACNSEQDEFIFRPVCGALSMHVDGEYDGYVLSTPKKEALGYEFLQVKITDKEQIYAQYKGNPVLQIESSMQGSDILVYLPDKTSLKAFTLKLKQNGEVTKIYKHTEPVTVNCGVQVNLGDITADVEQYDNPFSADVKDLDANGNANCYIVTEPGTYKFKAVKGNNPLAYVSEPEEAVVLWETWNDLSEVTPNSVIAAASYAEDFIILRMPETLRPGNAVVAVKNGDGKILWSWHIWVPQTAIVTGSFGNIMGADVMDRNLGALVATAATDEQIDILSYGMMYQWGRKDPYTAAGAFNSGTPATCAGEPEVLAAGQITLEEAIANPRLMGHVNNGDWTTDTNNNYWNELEKTIYDPCPPGYRVPNRAGNFWASDVSAQSGWAINATAGWLKVGEGIFPIAGYRDDYGVDSIAKVGSRTLYWFARNSGDVKGAAADLRYDKSSFAFGSAPKARMGSVRCVVE